MTKGSASRGWAETPPSGLLTGGLHSDIDPPLDADPPEADSPLDADPPSLRYMGYYGIRSTDGRYISYWNAILLKMSLWVICYSRNLGSRESSPERLSGSAVLEFPALIPKPLQQWKKKHDTRMYYLWFSCHLHSWSIWLENIPILSHQQYAMTIHATTQPIKASAQCTQQPMDPISGRPTLASDTQSWTLVLPIHHNFESYLLLRLSLVVSTGPDHVIHINLSLPSVPST